MLRARRPLGTPFGLKVKEIMDTGALVSDDVMIGVVAERLDQNDAPTGATSSTASPGPFPRASSWRSSRRRRSTW